MADPPFPFVVSMPRSGSTLLRAMLDSHPVMAVPWESYFIPEMWIRRSRYDGADRFDSAAFCADLRTTKLRHWDLVWTDLLDELDAARPANFGDAVRAVFRHYAHARGKPRFGDKTPRYLNDIALIAGLLPEARFVHLVRDGRDVATSMLGVGWGASTVQDVALNWRFRLREARRTGRQLGPDRYREVHYEDLVARPEQVLRTVCEFVELDFDPAMFDYRSRAAELVAPDPHREHHTRLALAPTPGLRNWREELTAEQVRSFESIASMELRDFGYTGARRDREPGDPS